MKIFTIFALLLVAGAAADVITAMFNEFEKLVTSAEAHLGSLKPGEKVETTYGPVEGVVDPEKEVKVWWGIPFAAPPVGDLRFAPPQPPKPWNETVKAVKPPSWCPQIHLSEKVFLGSEDCLYINVYAPLSAKAGDKLPVMYWIFGGGFILGDGYEMGWYDGRNLVQSEGIVLVTVNYRLDNLGFMALKSMMDEHGTTGTYAVLDQQLGLKWVQANIERFGGDPSRVMIAGESAGGTSVTAQLSMPGSKGLFSAAVVESGLPMSSITFPKLNDSIAFGDLVAEHLGCPSGKPSQLQCLRSIPLDDLLTQLLVFPSKYQYADNLPRLMPIMSYWPVVDGVVIPDTPYNLARAGKIHDVAIIQGTNHNEGSLFAPLGPLLVTRKESLIPPIFPFTWDGMSLLIHHIFPNNKTLCDEVYHQYRKEWSILNPLAPSHAVSQMIRDYIFVCPARFMLEALHPHNTKGLHMYHFTFNMDHSPLYEALGDYHTAEISYVFGNPWVLHSIPAGIWGEKDKTLSRQMQSYWASLARSGAPNSSVKGAINWPQFTPTDHSHIIFDSHLKIEKDYFEDYCNFWAARMDAAYNY